MPDAICVMHWGRHALSHALDFHNAVVHIDLPQHEAGSRSLVDRFLFMEDVGRASELLLNCF